MVGLPSLILYISSCFPSSFLLNTFIVLISIASYFLVSALFKYKHENWKNAPPGPIGWPLVGSLPHITEHFHEDLFNLAKRYGPLLSIKMGLKPAIVVSSPEMAYEVLKLKEAAFFSRSLTEGIRAMTYNAISVIFVPHGPQWMVLRRIMSTEFLATKSLQTMEPIRKLQVHGSLKELYSTSISKASVKIAEVTFVAMANIVSNLLVSESLFDIKKKEGRELRDTFWEMLQIMGTANIADLIPMFKPLDPQGMKRRAVELFGRVDPVAEMLVDKRLQDKNKNTKRDDGKMDILDVLLEYRSDSKEDGFERLPKLVMKGMIAELFLAGTETTSSTIEWGMAEILRKPDVYLKIVSELDQVVGKERFVDESDIANLTYFQAAIKEVFRLHPALPLLIPRIGNEACQIDGYDVPKDCIVYVNVWGMGRDPKVWEKPLEFMPERFIGSSIDVKGQDFELLPFGTGRRSCVGKLFAHRMVHYFIAALLHAFEWEFPTKILEDRSEKVGLTVRKGTSLIGIPKARLADYVYQ